MKILSWLLKAAIFFTLFAFALNNQQDAAVHFFFGTQWRAPMVLIVLTAFAAGICVGVLGMVPRWWKHRKAARQVLLAGSPAATTPSPASSESPAVARGAAAHSSAGPLANSDRTPDHVMPPYALPLDDDGLDNKYPHGV